MYSSISWCFLARDASARYPQILLMLSIWNVLKGPKISCVVIYLQTLYTVLSIRGSLTLQSYTVHSESSGQLGGNLHAATYKSLPKHVLEGLVEGVAVAQLADHGDGVLKGRRHFGMNKVANMTQEPCTVVARRLGLSSCPTGRLRGLSIITAMNQICLSLTLVSG